MTSGPLDTCGRILELLAGRAEAEVTVVNGRSGLTRFANSHIHQNVAETGQWVRLKVILDGRQATASTTRAHTGLGDLVDRALEAARLRPVDPSWPGLAPPEPPGGLGLWDDETATAHAHRRAKVVADFVSAGPDLEAAGYCETSGTEMAFANSAGQELWGRTTRAVIEGIHRSAHADGGGQQVEAHLGALDGAAAGRRAASKARVEAEPMDVEPGDWEVVLEPNCVVDMLDFLCGGGFNAKDYAEGQSWVHLGEAQMDPAVTIRDDALDPRIIGLPFDAEGTPRQRLDLVVGGVSSALAHDRRSAAAAGNGTTSTGHAVPGGEMVGPVPHNLILEPGDRSPDELVASVERGLLVTDFWYTRILDPKTTVVTGLTRNGTFLVERGKIVGAVRNLRFTQAYLQALAPGNVLGIGNDGRIAGEDQHFAPSLHLRSFHFSGGAKG